jgi:hypothetical protein
MNKTTIYYVIGGLAVLGIGYYFWNKSKKSTEEKEATDVETDVATDVTTTKRPVKDSVANTTSSIPTTVTAPTPAIKKLTPQELESKLAVCGKKPKLKKNKTLWNNCRNNMKDKLKSQGLLAFDGSYSFEGSNDFYSELDNNFDLNL